MCLGSPAIWPSLLATVGSLDPSRAALDDRGRALVFDLETVQSLLLVSAQELSSYGQKAARSKMHIDISVYGRVVAIFALSMIVCASRCVPAP